jgi:hypothetical protein
VHRLFAACHELRADNLQYMEGLRDCGADDQGPGVRLCCRHISNEKIMCENCRDSKTAWATVPGMLQTHIRTSGQTTESCIVCGDEIPNLRMGWWPYHQEGGGSRTWKLDNSRGVVHAIVPKAATRLWTEHHSTTFARHNLEARYPGQRPSFKALVG